MSGRRGARRAVAGLAFALVLAPVVMLVAVVPRMAQDAATDAASRRVSQAAEASAAYVEGQLGALTGLAVWAAGSPLLLDGLAPGGATADTMVQHRLDELLASRPGLVQVVLADPAGTVVRAAPGTVAPGRSLAYQEWYSDVMATGRASVSGFHRPVTGGPLVTSVAAPVRSPAGKVAGVLVLSYGADAMGSFVERFATSQDIAVAVVDHHGQVGAYPEGRRGLTQAELRLVRAVGSAPADRTIEEGKGQSMAAAAPTPSYGWAVLAQLRDDPALERASQLSLAVNSISGVLAAAFLAGAAMLVVLWRGRSRAQAALAGAHAAAVSASELKTTFLANMSHEIRTPMNGIIGMADLLVATSLSPRQRGYVDALRSSGEHLLGILNDLLDLSKIEAGRLELEDIDYDAVATAEDVVAIHAPAAHAKGLELAVMVEPEAPRAVRGDPLRFRQVLSNLVGNAVKFTGEGEVVVRVAGAGPATMRVEVCDTGVGIDATAQARLFESFTQAETSTTRTHGGTGLGLAISRHLVELMGGAIGVVSDAGQGSTFWFELRAPPAEQPIAGPRPMAELSGLRVLIVDDNATNRAVLEANTQAWGMLASTAASGEEALGRADAACREGAPFDIVLLDYHMPGMNGLEVAAAIRADRRLEDVRMALLTSSGFDGDPERVRELGIDSYLTKPVRQAVLYDELRALAHGRRRVWDEAPSGPAPAGPRPRVLVAEDQEINRQVATAMLDLLGYQAEVVADGAEAVARAAAGDYHAVLMDCQMPVMDGWTATEAIRRHEAGTGRRRVPIIAMTAGAMAGDEQRCLQAGMDAYLTKPVTTSALAAVLAASGGASGATPTGPPPPVASTGPPAAGADGVLDPDHLDELLSLAGGDPGTLATLVEHYLTSADDRLRALEDAAAAGDHTTLLSVGHSLRGSSASFAAAAVGDRCAALERLARDEAPPSSLQPAVAEVAAALEAARAALRAAVGDG